VHSLRHISDHDADRLLGGDLPAGPVSLDEIAVFVQDVEAAYAQPPTEPLKARHLDAMRRAARPRAEGRISGPGLPERLGRALSGLALRPRLAGAMAVLLLCASFSGMTAAGALPDPVQAAVADAARTVGVTVPDPAREHKRKPRRRPPARPRVRSAVPAAPAAPTPTQPPQRYGPSSAPADDAAPVPEACASEYCTSDAWDGTQTLDPPEAPPAEPPVELVSPPADPGADAPVPQDPGTDLAHDDQQAGEPAP
jgi:hypothetical protein